MSKGQAERDVGDDMAMIGVVAGICGSRFRSSGVLPLYEMKRSVSLCKMVLVRLSLARTHMTSQKQVLVTKTYISNISQITMCGFTRVHETRRHAHGLARRHELLPDVSGFSHAGDNEFAAVVLGLHDSFDGSFEVLLCDRAGAVESCYRGQSRGFCGENVRGVAEHIIVVVVVVAVVRWCCLGAVDERIFVLLRRRQKISFQAGRPASL
jgi:hypothetical protein